MLQQVSKLLIKNAKKVLKGKKTEDLFSYLNDASSGLKLINTVDDMIDIRQLDRALALRAAHKVFGLVKELTESKLSENEKTNSVFGVDLVSISRDHIKYVTFKFFLQSIENSNFKCQNLKNNLANLAKVYALTELQQDSVALYEAGYFSVGTAPIILDAQKHMMNLIRPQLLSLVEAWEYSDSY